MGWASITSFLFLFTVCRISLARTEGRTPWLSWLLISEEVQMDLDLPKYFYFKHLVNLIFLSIGDITLTFSKEILFWSCLHRRWRFSGIDEGVADGANKNPVLLHFCPEAVKEGLRCMFGGSICQQTGEMS